MHFSKILLKIFNTEIGRLLLISALLPYLCKGTTLATFNALGNTPWRKDRLIINLRGLATSFTQCLTIMGEMPSSPQAFNLILYTILAISSEQTEHRKNEKSRLGLR